MPKGRKIVKTYTKDSLELIIYDRQIEDADWNIAIDHINNKKYPLQKCKLILGYIEHTSIDSVEPGFIKLVKAIGTHTTLEDLLITFSSVIRDKKIGLLLEALKDNRSIKRLSAESEFFDVETAHAFAKLLMNNQTLASLNLSLYAEPIDDDDRHYPIIFYVGNDSIVELGRALKTTLIERFTMKTLDNDGFAVLAPFLPKTITYLDLGYNDMNSSSAPLLESYLKSNGNSVKFLILDGIKLNLDVEQDTPSASSTIRMLYTSDWKIDIIWKNEVISTHIKYTSEEEWSALVNESTNENITFRQLILNLTDEFNRDYLSYLTTILGKKSHLRSLILKSDSSDTEIQCEILELIMENKSITELEIEFEIRVKDIIELSNLFKKKNNFTHLSLKKLSKITDEYVIMLADSLTNNNILQKLDMSYNNQIDDNGFQALLSSLPTSIKDFLFESSRITAKSFPSILTFIKTHPFLEYFSIEENHINSYRFPEINVPQMEEEILAITNANQCTCDLDIDAEFKQLLRRMSCGHFDIYNYKLVDEQLLIICNRMMKDPDQSWSINIQGGNDFSLVGYEHLAAVLSSATPVSSLIIIPSNDIYKEAGIVFYNSLSNNKTLKYLRLRFTDVGEHIEYIERLLRNNSALDVLVLDSCSITCDSVVHLTKGLAESHLITLSLDDNPLGDLGCASLLPFIPPTLQYLSLNTIGITESSLQILLSFIDTHQTLQKLTIHDNTIFSKKDDNQGKNISWEQLKEAAEKAHIPLIN